jgi:hypothetical protein
LKLRITTDYENHYEVLSNCLKVVWFDIQSQSNEPKSLRELMINDSDESRFGMKGGKNFLELLVSKHVLLTECAFITTINEPAMMTITR